MTQSLIPIGSNSAPALSTDLSNTPDITAPSDASDWSVALVQATAAPVQKPVSDATPNIEIQHSPSRDISEQTTKTSTSENTHTKTVPAKTKNAELEGPDSTHRHEGAATSLSPFAAMLVGVATAASPPIAIRSGTTVQQTSKAVATTLKDIKNIENVTPGKLPSIKTADKTTEKPVLDLAPSTSADLSGEVPAAITKAPIANSGKPFTNSDAKPTEAVALAAEQTFTTVLPIAPLPVQAAPSINGRVLTKPTTTTTVNLIAAKPVAAIAAKVTMPAVQMDTSDKPDEQITTTNTIPGVLAIGPLQNNPALFTSSATNVSAPPIAAAGNIGVSTAPAALAAVVAAMHQTGQSSTVLRLDPPGLGTLSVHVGLGQNGQVNVLFVPALAQTAQLLNSGMDGLRHAMAASGLMLGQAQVGGQSGGQGNMPGGQTSSPNREAMQAAPITKATPDSTNGVRAYA